MVSPLVRKLGRDVRRHRAQFIAVAVTMFLGVTLFAASYDSFQNLRASYDATHSEFRFANLTIGGGDVAALAEEVGRVDGVEDIAIRSVVDVPFEIAGTKLLGRVVELPSGGQPPVNRISVVEGRYLDPANPHGILVEQHMAEHFGLTPGDTISILGGEGWFVGDVIGIAASPEYIWPARDRQNVITSPDNFGVVFAATDVVAAAGAAAPNELVVYYTDGRPDAALTQRLTTSATSAGATSVLTREEQASNAALEEDLRGFEEMALFFPILFLASAAMAAYVTISRLVATQRPYIGVMLANGFTRRQVLRHYLGYGLLPGVAGSIPGAIAGVLSARVVTRMYTELLAIPLTLIQFYPATLAAAIGFGLGASLLAALAPALAASQVQPALAMRGETPSGRGRRSLVERLIPRLGRLPLGWRMAMRSVGRNPRRTAYTVIGVVLSLTLVLVSWGMLDTIDHLLTRQYVEIQREDATVFFSAPLGAAEVAGLQEVPGISAIEPVLEAPVSLAFGDRHYSTVLVMMEASTTMHRFYQGGAWVDLPEDGMLVGRSLRRLIGIESGDMVGVTVADLGVTLDVRVAGFVDEPLGTLSYASRTGVEMALGAPLPATSALVRYDAGAEPALVRQAVTASPQVAAFEDANAVYGTMQDLMVLFYAFVGVMLVFGSAMAFALIFSSMTVNISERSREIATLLAVGTSRRAVSRLAMAENLLVVAVGIPLGLIAGYYMSKVAMSTFSSDLFAFDLYMRPTTFVLAATAMIVVALLSQWPGLRAVRRIDIARHIKERAA